MERIQPFVPSPPTASGQASRSEVEGRRCPGLCHYYVFGRGEATMSGATGQTGGFPDTMAGRSRTATAVTPSPIGNGWTRAGR